jgi:hypothetical protein
MRTREKDISFGMSGLSSLSDGFPDGWQTSPQERSVIPIRPGRSISICSFFDNWRISTTREASDRVFKESVTRSQVSKQIVAWSVLSGPYRKIPLITNPKLQNAGGSAKSSRKRQASVRNTNE